MKAKMFKRNSKYQQQQKLTFTKLQKALIDWQNLKKHINLLNLLYIKILGVY